MAIKECIVFLFTKVPLLRRSVLAFGLASGLAGAFAAHGLTVTPTNNAGDLQAALNATGLTIDSVNVVTGDPAQFGTYTGFSSQPVTIGNGVVLSSGFASDVVGPASSSDIPSSDMGQPGTPEFDAYGATHITNFQNSNDVAKLEVNFTLAADSQIKFDFVFGSIEYPNWVNNYTDSFLVFLDGAGNQITYDALGNPVQVGTSFTNLLTLADTNTAFADPHALLPKLTTTSGMLAAGSHTLWFEVGDVNDHVLDSAAFIANLRTGTGNTGTEVEPEDVPAPTAAWAALALFPVAWLCRRRGQRA